MADIHLDAAGSNTSTYDTWAKAATSIATAMGAEAAGDRVLMGSAYSESVATINVAIAGTAANPVQILSGTKDTTSGITALTAGAVFSTTSTTHTWSGSFYAYGVTFRGTSSSSHDMAFGVSNPCTVRADSCTFEHTGAGGSSTIQFGNGSDAGGGFVRLQAPTFKFGATGQRIKAFGMLHIAGGSIASGGTAVTGIFSMSGTRGSRILCEGFSFANAASTANLCDGQGGTFALFRDITLPASWTGAPVASGSVQEGQRVEVWNYTISGGATHRFWIRDRRCDLTPETTLVRTGGGSDAAGGYSVKMVTTANCAWPSSVAQSMEFGKNNTTTGSSITVSVEILRDSATNLTDREVWLEVEEPDGTITSDACASVITSAADQTSSSETWTTTGMTNPNKQTLSVTINASVAGRLLCRVMCAKPSTTLYICPKVTVA